METLDTEECRQIAAGRSALYDILSSIFIKEVSPELFRKLRSEEIRSVLNDMEFDTTVLDPQGSEAGFIDELGVEYAALFVGPNTFHVYPFESVYFEKQISGNSMVAARKFYEQCGLSLAASSPMSEFKVLPDHVGVELYFMKLLVDKERKAWEEEKEEEAYKAMGVQKEFLEKHLGRWIHLFCEKVIAFATLPFYAEFAKLTDRFLQGEMSELHVTAPKR